MKNLTRVLALVLVFTMMVSSAAFAAKFTDVAEDSTYAEAVEVLSALGIVNGDPAGTFRPDDVITRAEVVAICNRLQGLSDAAKAAAGTSMYTDVATSDWYAGDINLASQMGIVAGDGNGLFRPNDQVKYEEAVKMMVASLGYKQDYVLKQGGWPTGYLVIASQNEITKGLSATAGTPASRGVVAKLAYQTLTAPLMTLSEYDDEGKATYKPVASSTLLGTKLGYAMAYGHVVKNEVSSLNSNSQADKGYFDYKVDYTLATDKDGDTVYSYKLFDGVGTDLELNGDHTITKINVGETDIADTLGYATKAYFKLNADDEIEVLTYVDSNRNNNVATIEKTADIVANGAPKYASDYELSTNEAGATLDQITGEISVYDEEVDSTNTIYKLDDANIIYNGSWVSGDIDNAGTLYTFPAFAKAELLDNDGDGKYEYIFVTEYKTYVVDSVYGGNKKIGMKVGNTLDLTNFIEEKEGYTYSITLDGEEIAITDLKEYDVLSVAADVYNNTAKVLDIIVSRNVVEGAVEAIDAATITAGNELDKFKDVYQIAGTEYSVANVAGFAYAWSDSDLDGTNDTITYTNVPTITASTEGKFYVDAFGKIAYTEAETSISGNLAFIQGIGEYNSVGTDVYEVEVLNKDGSVTILTLADNVTVKMNAALVGKETSSAVKARIEALLDTTVNPANATNFAKRIVSYKTNASGKISAISFAVTGTPETEGLVYATGSATDEYDSSVNSLDTYGVKDSTIIFYLPTAAGKTKEDYKVADVSMLVNEKEYDTAYLDIDEDLNAGVVIITSEIATVGEGANLAIVTGSVVATNEDGEKVIKVSFLQNGEEKALFVDPENTTYGDADNNLFKRGSVFEYTTGAEGYIDDATIYTAAAIETLAESGSFNTARVDDGSAFQYIYGYVKAKSGSTLSLNTAFDGVGGSKVSIPSSANVYTMDVTKTKIAPVVAAIGDVVACKHYVSETDGNNYAEEEADTFVMIKYIDKTIVDVVAFYGFGPFEN